MKDSSRDKLKALGLPESPEGIHSIFVNVNYESPTDTRGLERASEDVLHARRQGMHAFSPVLLPERNASCRLCPYGQSVYREAYHHGYHTAALDYVRSFLAELSSSATKIFRKSVTYDSVVKIWEP